MNQNRHELGRRQRLLGVFVVALLIAGCDGEDGGSMDDDNGDVSTESGSSDGADTDSDTGDTTTGDTTGDTTTGDTTGDTTDDTTTGDTTTGDTTDTGDTGDTTDTGGELAPEDLAEIDAVYGELEMIAAGAVAYFAQEQAEAPFHRCPFVDGFLGGEASYTPPLPFNCNEGEGGKCLPVHNGGGAGQYSMDFWELNQVWVRVGWMRPEGVPHEFHYNFYADGSNTPNDYGECNFTAEARADFDNDNVFSIYSLSGHVDEQGAILDPIVVELPFE